jgi:hypothetical protein
VWHFYGKRPIPWFSFRFATLVIYTFRFERRRCRFEMSTPARLVRLSCPNCAVCHWVIDCDFPGEGMPELDLPFEKRTYACPHCSCNSTGHQVQEKSPPEFFLQPHEMYPTTSQEFEKWLAVLQEYFPGHPMLADAGTKWYPGRKRP